MKEMPLELSSPISRVAGVGPKKQEYLASLGIYTVYDLLMHFPRAYQNRGEVSTLMEAAASGEKTAMILTVGCRPKTVMLKNRKTITKFTAFDGTGTCEVIFFNQNYIASAFSEGDVFRFWGRVERYKYTWQLSAPEFEAVRSSRPLPDLYPVYRLTAGISQKVMQSIIGTALASLDKLPGEPIPASVREKAGIADFRTSLFDIHRPANLEAMERAREYFVFEELFVFAMRMLSSAKLNKDIPGIRMSAEKADMERFYTSLPFDLTGAQKRVIDDILGDMTSGKPMHRLVQGDVGSGKTVCAAAAAYFCVKNGYQCALMAPTEILARQHYTDLEPLLGSLGIRVSLLVGSLTAAEKRKVHNLSASGGTDLVIGTHALISDGMSFKNGGLIITDEQHRFGVGQREALSGKALGDSGTPVHTLSLSATPIPRTLALVMLSDVDVSVIDELPPGRQKVSTFLVDESYRARLEGFICKQADEGKQVYVVCPAIENSGDEDEDCDLISITGELITRKEEKKLKSAVEYYEDFSARYPNIKTAYLHGKMSGKEKDSIMRDFADGKISVLVSTTVIEVGVNVPNATLMVVENAERFGLSQLHQLRGRVGRGAYKSWCILVSDSDSENAKKRLETLCKTNNGFEIARVDLEMRGPGDFFETVGSERQHGELSFRLATLCDNSDTLNLAFSEARRITDDDPNLEKEENRNIAEMVALGSNSRLS